MRIANWIVYIFNLQGFQIYVHGAEHLWYLTIIMICYLITPILNKYRRKITDATNIDDTTKYELLQRLEGMKNHDKLCHGDFVPSNIIVKENGEYAIIDWSHATQGNGSADVANTYLIFSMRNQKELAEKYVNLYCEKTGTDKKEVQRWIPIVAAIRKTKGKAEEQEMLEQWINIVDYE